MTTMTGMEQISTLFQKEGARKVMTHLQFQPEFIERTLSALFDGTTIPTSTPIVPTPEASQVDTIVSTGKAKKGDKPKRKYTKSAQGSAWTEFSKAHRAEITAQVKSEGVEPKKVAGEVGKRLGALWKEAKENPKSGSNTPPSEEEKETPSTPKVAEETSQPTMEEKKVLLDLGKGEVECIVKGDELWHDGKQIGTVGTGEDGEDEYTIIEEEE